MIGRSLVDVSHEIGLSVNKASDLCVCFKCLKKAA